MLSHRGDIDARACAMQNDCPFTGHSASLEASHVANSYLSSMLCTLYSDTLFYNIKVLELINFLFSVLHVRISPVASITQFLAIQSVKKQRVGSTPNQTLFSYGRANTLALLSSRLQAVLMWPAFCDIYKEDEFPKQQPRQQAKCSKTYMGDECEEKNQIGGMLVSAQ